MRVVVGRRWRVAGLALVLLLGCADSGPHTLNRPALRASKPRTLIIARYSSPSFVAKTYSGAIVGGLFGLAGIAVAEASSRSNGAELAGNDAILDPAVAISSRLAEALSKRFSVQLLHGNGALTFATSPGDLAAQYPGSDLVLAVRTSDWGFRPTAAGRYGTTYDGTLTLIDGRTRTVLAEGICSLHPVHNDEGPTYDELLADGAAVLKGMLRSITDNCADDYRTRILGLYQ